MTFKLLKPFEILLFSASFLGAGLLSVSSLPTAVLAQDTGEPLPEEVEPSPEETIPAPEEVTPGTSPEETVPPPTEAAPGTSVESNAEPGSFACDNNPNPVCENPERNVSEDWGSENNPGPEYSEPPRLSVPLEPGSWACDNNQNVTSCETPIRYSVEDPETWPDRFPPAGQRTFGGT